MKVVLFLTLVLALVFFFSSQRFKTRAAGSPQQQSSTSAAGPSLVEVVDFKCARSKQVVLDPPYTDQGPARAVIPQNKNYARNARINDPVGVRDPNEDTIDGRSAALEKITQEARKPPSKPVDGYAYQIKMQNAGNSPVEIVFWEYQFIDTTNTANVTRRQFLCGVKIKPKKATDVKAFSVSGPSEVVSVGSLANKAGNPIQEKVIINRVEYADGTIWQRKDWNFAEIGMSYRRAIATPWGTEMCRAL